MSEPIRSTRDVIMRTPDAKAAADFYQHVLGLAVTPRFGEILGFDTGMSRGKPIQLWQPGGMDPG